MSPLKKKGINEKHKKVLRVLQHFSNQHGYPPTIREICDRATLSSTSVASYYLDRLEENGYIERDKGISRGLRIIKTIPEPVGDQVRATMNAIQDGIDELLSIRLVGRIVASKPVPVPSSDFDYFDPETDAVNIAKSMLPLQDQKRSNLFALEVQGDSMIDAMVSDGDVIIMKPAQAAHNGEMVAVWLNDTNETTLKYFYLEEKRVRLQPANPNMEPIYINDPSTVKIQGKVVMVVRQMEEQ
ncbi:MAG: transcriptional repressor LexA [Chloroflexota bacterium]|nr:transcriptional repressor LexA [Chloroflexota bacterium]